jgi:CheY-like chemotaxis protein
MESLKNNAEHHFLTRLEALKAAPEGWVIMHFALSRSFDHDDLIAQPALIPEKLDSARVASLSLYKELKGLAQASDSAIVYHFEDNDVLMLGRAGTAAEETRMKVIFEKMSGRLRQDICDYCEMERALYVYQQFADHKFLTVKRMDAYQAMAQGPRVQSIPIRRRRRDDPLVLIVEDDRFTASYATNLLGKQYELVHAKTGEDAIIAHIDNAPDIVFMDIHLPGLNGHQTLGAIKAVDPEAYAIMLSVDTEQTNVVSAHSNGANGFLKKPFSKDRLLATVEKSPFVRRAKASASTAQTEFYD